MRLLEPKGTVRLRLGAVGDIGLVGPAREACAARGYAAVLEPLRAILQPLDLAFANLEFAIAEPDWILEGRTRNFWHEPQVAAGLAGAGIGIVSLANNHIMDAGPRGLARTLEACRAAGLPTVGAGATLDAAREPARLKAGGQNVVVLAYAQSAESDRATRTRPGVAPLLPELVLEDVARWRPSADVLVVSVHWGSMYVAYPPPAVVALASDLARQGVDLVLGHHAHVLQGARREGNTLTLFSLGDAACNASSGDLDIAWTRERRSQSAAFVALLADEPGLEVHGLRLDDAGLPRAMDAAEAAELLRYLEELSADWERAGLHFQQQSAPGLVRYEFGALAGFLRSGRIDLALRLLGSVRPRHLPLLLGALRSLVQRG